MTLIFLTASSQGVHCQRGDFQLYPGNLKPGGREQLMSDIILLSHGDGGALTHKLIDELFLKYFYNEHLTPLTDAVNLGGSSRETVISTDSFVVSPIFFPGGDIGRLAVCGTVNDIAVCGAQPRYLTAAFILEEGLAYTELEKVVSSMASAAEEAGVYIVAGDTKVVERGHGDKIFINTSGIGYLLPGVDLGCHALADGDRIVISGTVGDHGLTVLTGRQNLGIEGDFASDSAPLNGIIERTLKNFNGVKIMRDPTRGGLATTLKEIAGRTNFDFIISEEDIPVQDSVRSAADMLGLDPLYLANEGKFMAVVEADQVEDLVHFLRGDPLGREAKIIGGIKKGKGEVYLQTFFGGRKPLQYLAGAPLPRIC